MPIDVEKILTALQTNPEAALSGMKDKGADLIQTLKTDPKARQTAMSLGGAALAGMLAGKAAPRLSGTVLKAGALAALGGLAWTAYKRHQAGEPIIPTGDAVEPHAPEDPEARGKAMIAAMIAAAKADGGIDATESSRILGRLTQIDLSEAEKDFVFAEMAKPLDLQEIAALGATPEQAAEVYAASLAAIDPDSEAERVYLQRLAAAMSLSDDLVARLHAEAGA